MQQCGGGGVLDPARADRRARSVAAAPAIVSHPAHSTPSQLRSEVQNISKWGIFELTCELHDAANRLENHEIELIGKRHPVRARI